MAVWFAAWRRVPARPGGIRSPTLRCPIARRPAPSAVPAPVPGAVHHVPTPLRWGRTAPTGRPEGHRPGRRGPDGRARGPTGPWPGARSGKTGHTGHPTGRCPLRGERGRAKPRHRARPSCRA
ncbi:hypothetical protein LK06_000410 [Streptomyces pluripotens]|nr:hypothetical protein LK06_000410 [Streptomyces pluripotens]